MTQDTEHTQGEHAVTFGGVDQEPEIGTSSHEDRSNKPQETPIHKATKEDVLPGLRKSLGREPTQEEINKAVDASNEVIEEKELNDFLQNQENQMDLLKTAFSTIMAQLIVSEPNLTIRGIAKKSGVSRAKLKRFIDDSDGTALNDIELGQVSEVLLPYFNKHNNPTPHQEKEVVEQPSKELAQQAINETLKSMSKSPRHDEKVQSVDKEIN